MARVSILIPSRNERFLVPTVRDLLVKAAGDVEVCVCLDGYWPDPPLPDDKRIKVLHVGRARGMRPALNALTQIATGDYYLKADAHTMWAEGYDDQLVADYLEDNWLLTPRRYALDAEAWAIDASNPKYPIDYEALSWPWQHPGDPMGGFHGQPWTARRDARKDVLLDEDLSSQGSAWFMRRTHWQRLAPMRADLFGSFYSESQELGLQTQLRGGAMMRTKRTWYAHLRKSAKYGRGYVLGPSSHHAGVATMVRRCVMNEWPQQTRTLEALIERFMPVPGWPSDWAAQLATHREAMRHAA